MCIYYTFVYLLNYLSKEDIFYDALIDFNNSSNSNKKGK